MRRYAPKRFYEWSPAIAYSVGLMASDGCLSKDGRHVDLTSVDIEQLKNFKKAISREIPISKKSTGRVAVGQEAYRVQFSDVAYYDFLIQVGLTPNKSKTISSLGVPDQYYSHFLRGLFDGDGSTYSYYDNRWKSSYMYYVTFASASRSFIDYLRETNARLFGVGKGSVRVSPHVLILCYAKHDSRILYKALYANSDELFLNRKYVKLTGFINHDEADIISKNARVAELVYA